MSVTSERETHVLPSDVIAVGGRVMIDGPGGIAIAMSPAAANETADRLKANAFRAASQDRAGDRHAAEGKPEA